MFGPKKERPFSIEKKEIRLIQEHLSIFLHNSKKSQFNWKRNVLDDYSMLVSDMISIKVFASLGDTKGATIELTCKGVTIKICEYKICHDPGILLPAATSYLPLIKYVKGNWDNDMSHLIYLMRQELEKHYKELEYAKRNGKKKKKADKLRKKQQEEEKKTLEQRVLAKKIEEVNDLYLLAKLEK